MSNTGKTTSGNPKVGGQTDVFAFSHNSFHAVDKPFVLKICANSLISLNKKSHKASTLNNS